MRRKADKHVGMVTAIKEGLGVSHLKLASLLLTSPPALRAWDKEPPSGPKSFLLEMLYALATSNPEGKKLQDIIVKSGDNECWMFSPDVMDMASVIAGSNTKGDSKEMIELMSSLRIKNKTSRCKLADELDVCQSVAYAWNYGTVPRGADVLALCIYNNISALPKDITAVFAE